MTIDELHLSPNAKRAAEWIANLHPEIIFTSGRRDAREQARAMAVNVHRYGGDWLDQTYRNKAMVDELRQWMQDNMDVTGEVATLSQGFYETLMRSQAGEFQQFPHCRGDAFDIACPVYPDGRINEGAVLEIRRKLLEMPDRYGLDLVLTREGQHRVIHVQFKHQIDAIEI